MTQEIMGKSFSSKDTDLKVQGFFFFKLTFLAMLATRLKGCL